MRGRTGRILLYFLSVAITFAIWHLMSLFVFNPRLVPPPPVVVATGWEMVWSLELFEHVARSLQRIFVGYALGSALGIVMGTLMGRIELFERLLDPPLTLVRQIPPVAIIPLAIVWFGIGEGSRYFVIAYGVLLVVLINSIAGVKSTPEIRIRAAHSLGAGRLRIFLTVVLPSAVPYILTGMRLGLGFSFAAVVAAEIIAANTGIGYLIMQSRFLIQIDRMFVGLFVLGVLGALSDQLYRVIVDRTMWRFTVSAGRH